MGNSARRHTQALMLAERRRKVCELTATGLGQKEVALMLGISKPTVCRDIAVSIALAAEKHTEAAVTVRRFIAEGVADDLGRTEAHIRQLEARTKELAQAPISNDPDTVLVHTKLSDALTKWVTKRTELRAQLSKLYGADASERVEVTGKDGGPIETKVAQDELLSRIARLAAAAGAGAGDPEPDGGGSAAA